MLMLPNPLEFDWDRGNSEKNLLKHNVSGLEIEEVFLNNPVVISQDEKHSKQEARYMLWGIAKEDRKLTIIFTIRKNKVRVISARDMNKKERSFYEKETKANSTF